MTNYLLPETDRIAGDVNPVLSEVASMESHVADAVEVGAITVIGLLGESLADLRDTVREQAAAEGVSQETADEHFDVVFNGLADILQPRLNSFRDAVGHAQGIEEDPMESLIRLLTEAADAEWEDDEEEEEPQTYTDGSEPEEFTDEDMEREFTEFLNALFGRRP